MFNTPGVAVGILGHCTHHTTSHRLCARVAGLVWSQVLPAASPVMVALMATALQGPVGLLVTVIMAVLAGLAQSISAVLLITRPTPGSRAQAVRTILQVRHWVCACVWWGAEGVGGTAQRIMWA